jgi:hypothetical protein
MGDYMKRNAFKLMLTAIVFALILTNMAACLPSVDIPQYYIFANISECKGLEELNFNNSELTVFASSDEDELLRSLPYQKFYGARYVSDELNFEIFAYEFDSPAVAKAYFNRAIGENYDADVNYIAAGGAIKYELSVLYYEKAYHVNGYVKESELLEETLSEIFSKRVSRSKNS